jgi:hypothetical protein
LSTGSYRPVALVTVLHLSSLPMPPEARMLTCKEAMKNLSAFLNRTLPHKLHDEVDSHLWHCEECPRVMKIGDIWVLQEPLRPPRKAVPLRAAPRKHGHGKLAPRRPALKSA